MAKVETPSVPMSKPVHLTGSRAFLVVDPAEVRGAYVDDGERGPCLRIVLQRAVRAVTD